MNFLIELLKIYKNMVLTSFFDLFQPLTMKIGLILHLNFAHIKPQQTNRFDSSTDTDGAPMREIHKKLQQMVNFFCPSLTDKMVKFEVDIFV